MYYLAPSVSFCDDSCLSGVGKCEFYEEREAIITGSVPSVPIESFIGINYIRENIPNSAILT